MTDEENKIVNCTLCEEAFCILRHDDWGDVLDHWAREHNDSEEFWRTIGSARTWTRCGCCGEMFVSQLSAGRDGLLVKTYCEDCADNGLEERIKGLMVEDVSGRYALEHDATDDEAPA